MRSRKLEITCFLLLAFCVVALPAAAQSFRVQCPTSTITHPVAANNNTEPSYDGPTQFTPQSQTPLVRGDPATTDGATSGNAPWTGFPAPYTPAFTWNGAVGLAPEVVQTVNISDAYEGTLPVATPPAVVGCPAPSGTTVTIFTYEPIGIPVGGQVVITGVGTGYVSHIVC